MHPRRTPILAARTARRGALSLALAAGLAILAPSRPAAAFTIQTQVTQGCHESISADALRRVRTTYGTGAPLPSLTDDDGALLDDVPFDLPGDMHDIGSVALLLGVRDNDIKNISATGLDQLAQLTADPASQREHCLRTEGEDEPDGSSEALDDCRGFIKDRLMSALDGLGADGTPDGTLRDGLDVTLPLRGEITVQLPRFYLRMGQAIHAIQDGFAHTFRLPADPHQVTVVCDWIDYADNNLNETTEGPPHLRQLDRCDDPDALRATRHALAIEASAAALQIALDATQSSDQKSASFDAMLATYLAYDADAGCTSSNGWCDAPENQYRPGTCGCSVVGAASGVGASATAAAMVAVLLVLRRRMRRKNVARAAAGVAALLAATGLARTASAEEPPAKGDGATHGPAAALRGESKAGTPNESDKPGAFFAHAAAAGSYDHAAMAFSLGARYQFAAKWMVGLDVEDNPWIETTPTAVRPGSANAYGSIIRRYQMVVEQVNFRTTAQLGASALLVQLPGAKTWSVGPLAGISFLGVEFKMHPGFYLVIDPTNLVVAIPHVTGTPLVYYQYRFQVGIEFGG